MMETVSQWATGFVAACTSQNPSGRNPEICQLGHVWTDPQCLLRSDKDGQPHAVTIMDDMNLGDAY